MAKNKAPEAYMNKDGRVFVANASLHRLATKMQLIPCTADGKYDGPEQKTDDTAVKEAFEKGKDAGWAEAKAELGTAIEKAKEEAFELGRQEGMKSADKPASKKPAAK